MEKVTVNDVQTGVERLINNIKKVMYIRDEKLEYLLASKLAGGHVILADFHGVGKTSLARALAGSIIWDQEAHIGEGGVKIDPFSRVQCTVDLLPQDILGYTRMYSGSEELVFIEGPIFAHFILCDEINLLTPKTQGSFFQAMQEQTVTIERRTYHLPDPFFIIATMNLEGVHLFPLPAPQLDRFMIQLSIGFPEPEVESSIIKQHGQSDAWEDFGPVIPYQDLLDWQKLVDEVTISDEVIRYIVACIGQTRGHPDVHMCASPRAGIKVSRMARALALLRGRNYVDIDLVKEIFIPSMAHRIIMQDSSQKSEDFLMHILDTVPVEQS
jgi:MoxR-like ATPase